MNRTKIGLYGQGLAEGFLRSNDYEILATNYSTGKNTNRGEIDIIACKNGALVGVEVKTRRSRAFGGDGETLLPSQARRIAGLLFLFARERQIYPRHTRLDLINVELDQGSQPKALNHLEDIDYE